LDQINQVALNVEHLTAIVSTQPGEGISEEIVGSGY
jgi:hypothetical protein